MYTGRQMGSRAMRAKLGEQRMRERESWQWRTESELGWQVGPSIYCKHLVYLAAVGHDVSTCWVPESRLVALSVYHTHPHTKREKISG